MCVSFYSSFIISFKFYIILDVLIIADDIVRNVQFPHAQWIFLKEQQGYSDIQEKTAAQTGLKDIKLVILMTGRAEVVAQHKAVINCIQSAVEAIKMANSDAVIMLCAPLPYPRDGDVLLQELGEFSKTLNDICRQSEYLEYSKIGQAFIQRHSLINPEGGDPENVLLVKPFLMDRSGLTLQGARLISSKLLEKVSSAKLFERYDLLKVRLIRL